MRSFLVVPVVLSFVFSTAAAQDTPPTPSRWTFSVGPEWTGTLSNGHYYGGRLRAEYDLVAPTSPLRLRLEAGGFWSPTQTFVGSYLDGSSVSGFDQTLDLTFGVSAAIAPLPRARFSPYVMLGAYARQSWSRRSTWRWNADGSPARNYASSGTVGGLLFQPGIGTRARIGGRMFQLELRHFDHRSLTLGTNLPF
jgi:hypothetical protein